MMQGTGLLILSLALLKTVAGQDQCNGSKTCRPKANCVLTSGELSSSECDLPAGGKGSCCEDEEVGETSPSISLSSRTDNGSPKKILRLPDGVSERDVEVALRNSETVPRVKSDKSNRKGGHGFFTRPRDGSGDILDAAYKLLNAKKSDGSSFSSNDDEFGVNADNSNAINGTCIWRKERKPHCDRNRKYRTEDGSCNNVQVPLYGLQGTPFRRIVAATYKPGGLPRRAVGGEELPSARLVSTTVFSEGVSTDADFSVLLMQNGQFLAHDLAHAPAERERCCDLNADERPFDFPEFPSSIDENKCFPIEVPQNDPVWGQRGTRGRRGKRRTCMDLPRSMISPSLDCKAGVREQTNDVTHWLDMSIIYGSTTRQTGELRHPEDRHLLLVTEEATIDNAGQQRSGTVRNILPQCLAQSRQDQNLKSNEQRSQVEICEGCEELNERHGLKKCFFSGDIRTNEQPGLTTLHTIWVREHNRIAKELFDLKLSKLSSVLSRQNLKKAKEVIFEETRRIVIAEWQHIIYQEFLPIVIGRDFMRAFEMLPMSSGYSSRYNPSIDPRIDNEFAVAAFRFGHSLIFDAIPHRDENNRQLRRDDLDLKEVFNQARELNNPNFIDNTLRGLVGDAVPAFDADFTEDILNNLFEDDLDLPALNIQRGRDHGIPGYNVYRKICANARNNFGEARSIDELSRGGRMSSDAVRKLKQVYNDIDDVDLFVGGMLEVTGKHGDSLLGQTFKCIIGHQFNRLKIGDRFWYENADSPSPFTLPQLDEIRSKVSMARILCDNSDIGSTQPLAFKRQGRGNSRVQCNDKAIPRLDISVFLGGK